MEYREHLPAPALRYYVACYWSLRGVDARRGAHRVLPDGCMDLLFDLGHDPSASVVGVMTTALVSTPATPEERVDLLGVRFWPGEAPAFLAIAAGDARDRALAMRDVCGRWGHELASRLLDATLGARLTLLDDALSRRSRRHPPDRRLRGAIGELLHGADVLSRPVPCPGRAADVVLRPVPCPGRAADVSSVAARVGLSERHLRRLFDEHVGLGPKAFARMARVQALVKTLDSLPPGEPPRWAALAAAHGFADQAHLVRDTRALAGVTPTVLFRERASGRLGMSETFNPPAALNATVGT
jgi:AraC-like DNA-binding protein